MDSPEVTAPVVRVELFEDRASVTRRVHLESAGRQRVLLRGLSPLVREEGLAFPGSAGVVVEEARVVRERWLPEIGDTAEEIALRERLEALSDALSAAEARALRAEARAERAEGLARAAGAWAPWALLAESDGEAWVDAFRALVEGAAKARVAAREAGQEVSTARREVEDVRRRLRMAREGRTRLRARLELKVLAPEGGGTVDLRYTIPCALWRPAHRATLSDGRLAWETGAMAWNATGEDWTGVTLVCSTARPAERAEAPILTDDVLVPKKREKDVVVQTREEVIEVAREGAAKRTDEVPGVDDGGEPRTFSAPEAIDLPSSGRPVHVVLERWDTEAELAWVAHPERSPHVVLRSTQVNAGTRPLLAGPVDLYRESGAVGRGQVKLVAPGEPFPLGWGSHDEVRVSRRQDHAVERSRITGKQTHRFEVTTRLAHVGREPLTVTVRERIPVSELKEVRVPAPETTPHLHEGPDRDGICAWELTLQPGATRELSLVYTVEASSKVRLPW